MNKRSSRPVHAAALIMALVLTASAAGCNMLKGAGKDISNAGESIQRTVDHND